VIVLQHKVYYYYYKYFIVYSQQLFKIT